MFQFLCLVLPLCAAGSGLASFSDDSSYVVVGLLPKLSLLQAEPALFPQPLPTGGLLLNSLAFISVLLGLGETKLDAVSRCGPRGAGQWGVIAFLGHWLGSC